jgi:uncharacterized linocin/CFP29 family protein
VNFIFSFALDDRENLSAVVLFKKKFTIYLKNIYPAKRINAPVDIVMVKDAASNNDLSF